MGAQGVKSLSTIHAPALAADPHASATEVGMSLGAAKAPVTKIPGLVVSRGWKTEVLQNPYSLSSIPRVSANS